MASRGPDPSDAALFGADQLPALREAVHDLGWLLGRGYNSASALELVGNNRQLTRRQRLAVRRSACSEAQRQSRQARERLEVRGETLLIDGFNLLITVERALSDGPVLVGADGAIRDLASVHDTYRLVTETPEAIDAIGRTCAALGVPRARWLFDAPVSNSGRLAAVVRQHAAQHGWTWQIDVVPAPDPVLIASSEVLVTGDAGILDRCGPWFNLARAVLDAEAPQAWRVDLGSEHGLPRS